MHRGRVARGLAGAIVLGGLLWQAAVAQETPGLAGEESAGADYSFTLASADGKSELSFAQLADGDKPFVLIWWLSDCPVCHLQMPYIQQLQKLAESGEADLRIVSINVDGTCEGCLKYAKERSLSFEILSDPRARQTDRAFEIKALGAPVTYVFKAGGELAERFNGFKSGYAKAVLTALGQPIPESLSAK